MSFKNKITTVLSVAVGVCVLSSSAFAANVQDIINSSSIPKNFTPNSVIEYTSANNWKVVDQGNTYSSTNIDETDNNVSIPSSSSSVLSLEDENKLVEQIHKEAENLPTYVIELPTPVDGMRITYDNWGNVDEIYLKDNNGSYSTITKALPQGTRKEAGIYTYGSVVSNNVGYTTNKITIVGSTTGHVLGEGDFTVFTDTMGDHGNNLKRGDCATKGDTDNPRYGTQIQTRNMTNNIANIFTKNDNGSLPNAVLDIWKTGVQDLGISSTNYNNIKFAGRYYYEF